MSRTCSSTSKISIMNRRFGGGRRRLEVTAGCFLEEIWANYPAQIACVCQHSSNAETPPTLRVRQCAIGAGLWSERSVPKSVKSGRVVYGARASSNSHPTAAMEASTLKWILVFEDGWIEEIYFQSILVCYMQSSLYWSKQRGLLSFSVFCKLLHSIEEI